MIDVKKLITGFLILAVAATFSGLILSFVSNLPATAEAPSDAQLADAAAAVTTPTVPTNAFVDTGSLQGNAAEILSDVETSSTVTQDNDPNNLTDVFANSFLNGLVVNNPDGVSVDSSGTPAFNAPDPSAVGADIASAPAMQDFTPPDWDVEAQSQLIKTVSSTSPDAIAQYNAAVSSIFEKYFVSTNLQNEINDPAADPAQLPYVASQIQGALSDLLSVPTPSSLASLQRSLIQSLVYEKNTAQLGDLAESDPLKASLILQGEQNKYSAALDTLQQQMQKATALGVSFGGSTAESQQGTSLLATLLGIQTAHAQWLTFDAANFGEWLLNFLKTTILQILRNTLVSLIQKKVLTWVQGGNSGIPHFVTDFAQEMIQSFQTAAVGAINNELACLPSYQSPTLNGLLTRPNSTVSLNVQVNIKNKCSYEFGNQAGSAASNQNISTDVSGYLSIYGAGGNLWTNVIALHDDALSAADTAQTANQTQNTAGQGWKNGTGICVDGSIPTGSHQVCSATGNTCVTVPNGGKCADGSDPQNTSPDQVVGQAFNSALKASTENVTGAINITGIVEALLSSLLNTLAQNAINYANTAVNGALGGGATQPPGVTSIPPNSLTPPPSATPIQGPTQCTPLTQVATIVAPSIQTTATFSATGGTISSCATTNTCPATVNPDGTPIYSWTAPGSTQPTGTGDAFFATYAVRGTYTVSVTASTDNTTASCQITVQ